MAAWFTGERYGAAIAVLSASLWMGTELSHPSAVDSWLLYWNMIMRLGTFLVINHLLSALKGAYDREKRLARTDTLTGVTNRRYFQELLQAEYSRSRRYRYPLTVAYIDVDNFKSVNDQFGHGAGDLLLNLIAQSMNAQVRSIDVVSRLGGDEFAIMLPQTGPRQAQVVLPRVQQQLMQIVEHHGWPISFSIGVATFVRLPRTAKEMISQADYLMYSVKTRGKNRIEYEVYGQTNRLEVLVEV
ncbi:MAG: GGDEF domain-containing protein [Synechococcales cyanobacterium RM1_1_8]|nr:GGDEF domain-containing protein [Synechococcales cyanobacterium RM1_1_8]